MKEQGQINEEWNDKYIQNYSVEKATTGVSWYSFDVDTLEGTMYTKAFYSYGRTDDDLESYMYGIVNGKFTFDVNNAVVAKEINEENYKNIGLELSKVVTSVGDPKTPVLIMYKCIMRKGWACWHSYVKMLF